MKKLLGCLLCVFLISFVGSVGADTLVPETNALPGYTNPQYFSPSNPDDEEAWLEGLLGLIYDDPTVEFISKDELSPYDDNEPEGWLYAVLKFGVGAPPAPDHWALMDDGDGILELADVAQWIPTGGLSHVTYFSGDERVPPPPVPEPATMLLLGSGLVGLAGFGRKKFKK